MQIERLSDDVFVVRNAFSASECAALVERAERVGFHGAPITTHRGAIMMKRRRNNDRVMIDDIELAATLWDRLSALPPDHLYGRDAVGLNERFRFYRYDPGQAFRWHMDGYYERPNGERSQYTLMVYLNDDFEGGATEFHDCRITPERGTAAFFYHHQKHCGASVVSGRKYVLRTDVMYGPPVSGK